MRWKRKSLISFCEEFFTLETAFQSPLLIILLIIKEDVEGELKTRQYRYLPNPMLLLKATNCSGILYAWKIKTPIV